MTSRYSTDYAETHQLVFVEDFHEFSNEEAIWAFWTAQYTEDEARSRAYDVLDQIPEVEADIIEMALDGRSQTEIATILGASQGGISYRFRRGIKRVRWLLTLPPKPDSFDADVMKQRSTHGHYLNVNLPQILATLMRTTCQSTTAKLHDLAKRKDGSPDLSSGQSRVSELFYLTLYRLRDLKLTESYRYLSHLDGHMGILRDGFAYGTEVREDYQVGKLSAVRRRPIP